MYQNNGISCCKSKYVSTRHNPGTCLLHLFLDQVNFVKTSQCLIRHGLLLHGKVSITIVHPTATKHHTPDSSTPQMQHKVNKRSFTCIENSLIKMSSNQKLTCMVRLLTFLIITYLNYFLTN